MARVLTDILVIGGGPSGCAAALNAQKYGARSVTIVESQPYDRHRVGEILLTNTIMDFVRLGIHKDLLPYIEKYGWNKKYAASYVHGKDRTPWQVVNNHPGLAVNQEDRAEFPSEYVNQETGIWHTLVVRRHEFDEALREICERKGIEIIHGNVVDAKIGNKEDLANSKIISIKVVDKNNANLKIVPKFTIDATGQQSFLGKINSNRESFGDRGLQSCYAYLSDVDFTDAIQKGFYKEGANILSFDDGWMWIAYLGRNQTSVGIVSKNWDNEENSYWKKLKRLPEYELFGFKNAAAVTYKNEPADKDLFYKHSNYRLKTEVFAGLNWACSGDAALFLDPLLSQGVTLAVSYGSKIGKIAQQILNHEVGHKEALRSYRRAYINEIEILNKVVTLWYKEDFDINNDWCKTADKISKMFGREIGEDVESFRWISNLENIHKLFEEDGMEDFLKDLRDVNTIQMIHEFEEDQLNN